MTAIAVTLLCATRVKVAGQSFFLSAKLMILTPCVSVYIYPMLVVNNC